MFFVFNKEKIKAYLVSLSTVIVLLLLAVVLQNGKLSSDTIKTSTAVSNTPIYEVATDEQEVAITINCIKNMDNISNILDTLSKMNAKATFFITGDLADKYPEEIKKIINNGNEIGNLSDNYTSLKQMSKNDVLSQITKCNDKIEKLTNQRPTLFRSPYGEYNSTIIEAAESQNMKAIGWSIDSLDYNELSADEIWERIEEDLSNGSIILVHNEYISDNLEFILHNIEEKKYSITSVSSLL